MTNVKYEAWMNGRALSELSPDLFICSIRQETPKISFNESVIAGRLGSMADSRQMSGAKVSIGFYLKKSNGPYRQQVISEAAAWAKGGVLTISDRPGQQLHVACEAFPYLDEACDWTKPVEIRLRTFERPFWEEMTPSSMSMAAGTSGSGTLFVPGNAGKALVEVTAVPSSGTMNAFSITVGDTTMTFASLGATNANPLRITYDERLIQSIRTGTTSKLNKRTGASADDLLAECGAVTPISFTAGVAAAVTVTARGLWL